MYGKEFTSPQQQKSEKFNQSQRGLKVSQSTQQLHQQQRQQPANLPSKYARSNSQQRLDNREEQQRSRPQSASVYKSQSQRSLYSQPELYRDQRKTYQQPSRQMQPYKQSQQQQPQSKFLEREKLRQSQQQQKRQKQEDDGQFSRASQQTFAKQSVCSKHDQFSQLHPEKFLKTNIDEYLKQDQGRCISCSECMKAQEKNLFYKYPSQMKTNYETEYSKFDPNAKSRSFNLDKEKLSLKVPYKVQRDFTSTHQAEYRPFQVQPKEKQRQEVDLFEVENRCFIGDSTYNKTYQNWGANPAMKPRKLQPHIIDMKLQDKTTYKETFNSDKEKMPQFMKDHEEVMKKACVKKMQQGSLARHVDAPFIGKSVSHETFKKPKIPSKTQYRPIDELFVANLPLKTDSIHHTDYDAKKIDMCQFTLNKKKPIFD